jgi:dihydroorotate dehydrogenase
VSLYALARPALFALDPEVVHEATIRVLSRWPLLAAPTGPAPVADRAIDLFGMHFPNRVGLAAGLDKNAACVPAFERMGFGFIEVGTLTPRAQPGNPRPRMFRLPDREALINRLGFNNEGIDAAVRRLRALDRRTILGVNIGKNADTLLERAADDYVTCLLQAYDVADYFTVNLSSPNTQGLRNLQARTLLMPLLQAVCRARDEATQARGRRRPILVKIAPDLTQPEVADLASAVREAGADGLIATNTTVARPGLEGDPRTAQTGGLSGAPLQAQAEQVLRWVRAVVGADYPVIGVGGIVSAQVARARIAAGADLVQIYTGLIYHGPPLVNQIRREFARAQI